MTQTASQFESQEHSNMAPGRGGPPFPPHPGAQSHASEPATDVLQRTVLTGVGNGIAASRRCEVMRKPHTSQFGSH